MKYLKNVSLAMIFVLFAPNIFSADNKNRYVTVVNRTGSTILKIYATNAGDRGWGYDHLGEGIISVGYERRFNFSDGSSACVFDFKVVFSGSAPDVTGMAVNVCAVSRLNVHYDRITTE
jgi:hypothetical protein